MALPLRSMGRTLSPCIFIITLGVTLAAGPARAQDTPAPAPDAADGVVVDIDDLLPDEATLREKALAFHKEEKWAEAVTAWTDLLRFYPKTGHREEALYHAALGYRKLGRFPEARHLVETLAKQFPKSTYTADAAYLLGEIALIEEKWEEAMTWMATATRSEDADRREQAHYFRALAAGRLGEVKKARGDLEALVKDKKGRHLDFASLQLGILEEEAGKLKEASGHYQTTLSVTSNADFRAEAAVRAGNLAFAEKKFPDAVAFYEIVRRIESPERWRQLGHLGLIRGYYAQQDYGAVIRVFNEVKPAFPEAMRAHVLFMTAEAHRLTKAWPEAEALYHRLEKDFSGHALAEPAAWGRILCLNARERPGKELADALVAFLGRYPESVHAPDARRLRADLVFSGQDYATAGPMYRELAQNKKWLESQAGELREQILFRHAFCASANQESAEAIQAWNTYLQAAPDGAAADTAWWLKAQSELQAEKPADALQSLQTLLKNYPAFAEREKALHDAALLAGSLEKYPEMIRLLESLLDAYPLQPDKGELQYWLAIGYQKTGNAEKAKAAWKSARTLAPDDYTPTATQEIIRMELEKENVPAVHSEVQAYDRWQESHPNSPALPIEVYEWLGQELAEKPDPAAEPYLRRVLAVSEDPDQRQRTQLRLARLMSAIQRHGAAVREWKTYRVNHPEDADRFAVSAPLVEALLETAAYDEARSMIEFLLRRYPEGNENARARLYLGDLTRAEGNPAEAGRIYRAVALLIADPELTPLALYKAEQAYRAASLDQEADEMLLKLNKQFRDYTPPASE